MRRRVSGGDLVLAVMIVAIVAMMIVPVPSYVLDVLIGANLAGAVILLLEAVYIRRVLDLSTFPALLLITTLFRLAINISTTRLILLRGDAGRIVESFGSVVVSGSVLVGAVIFLVITIVQYLVIAKGAERAAEVSARFTLDSLPGRQMSIEADLRNGRLDAEQATLAREALKRESQLFGALEGAMKFVKGDAIATMVILVVNIVGGLARGVGQLGMPLGEAVRRYTLLTIGDGLISQIPALLITAAAGMVMTRVESPQGTSAVGREIGSTKDLTQAEASDLISLLKGDTK